MTHIYYGNGKGKTTAAVGQAVRAAGRGVPVLFVQFLKDGNSGEMEMLRKLPGVHMMHPAVCYGFTKNMTDEQKAKTAEACKLLIDQVKLRVGEPCMATENSGYVKALIVLDEVLHALRLGYVTVSDLMELRDLAGKQTELIMTGADAPESLILLADYVTHFVKEKHPFDTGILARTGIER